ncbi:Ig-like domain-containing protein [Capnocytophaga canis]|uniref:Ig-like domain-containing protein n=2 Tax=Capnocytophaga TaxID=1016 RepID=UPI00385FDDD6
MKKYVIKLRVVAIFLVTVMTLFAVSCIKIVQEKGEDDNSNIENEDEYLGMDLGDFYVEPNVGFGNFIDANLPSAFDLTADMPPIGNQGTIFSCASWAVCAVKSYYNHKKTGKPYSDATRMSPSYVHSQIRECLTDRCGALVKDAFNILEKQGVCTLAEKPYNSDECKRVPTAYQREMAARNRIKGYQSISFEDIKGNISQGDPVIIQFEYSAGATGTIAAPRIDNKGRRIWDTYRKSNLHHALVVIGYDDNEQLFKLFDSFGTGGKKKDGMIYVKYDVLKKAYSGIYIMEDLEEVDETPQQKTEAKISLSGNLNFGTVKPNEQVSKTLIVRNIGDASLNVTSINLPSGFSTDVTSFSVAPNSSREVRVSFSKNNPGTYSGDIMVNSNAANDSAKIAVSAQVEEEQQKTEARISLSGNLNFGTVKPNEQVSKTLIVRNIGDASLNVTSINLPSGFSTDVTSFSVAPNSSREVRVSFSKNNPGTYSGDIMVNSNAANGSAKIAVSAQVEEEQQKTEARISLSGNLNFGTLKVGEQSSRTLKVHNTGDATLEVTSISLPNGFSANSTSFSVAPNGSRDVQISFYSNNAGTYSGNITVNSNAISGSNRMAVSVEVERERQQQPQPTTNVRVNPEIGTYTPEIYQTDRCHFYKAGLSVVVGRVKSYNSNTNTVVFSIKKSNGTAFGQKAEVFVKDYLCSYNPLSRVNAAGKTEVDMSVRLNSRTGTHTFYVTVTSIDGNGNTHAYYSSPIIITFR